MICARPLNCHSSIVLLSTADAEIGDSQGFLMANFLNRDCANKLGLKCNRLSFPIESPNNMSFPKTQDVVRSFIKLKDDDGAQFKFEAIVLPKICSEQHRVDVIPTMFRI